MSRALLKVLILGIFLSSAVMAQDPPPELPTGGARPPGLGAASSDPQPYEKVITKDAKTKAGIFKVHQVKDKYYYEIPKSELGKVFPSSARPSLAWRGAWSRSGKAK